jgi:hypothetical protein
LVTIDQVALLEGICALRAGRGISLCWGSPQPLPKSPGELAFEKKTNLSSRLRAPISRPGVCAAYRPKAEFLYMLVSNPDLYKLF